jgi:LPS sulfotransferase NodH
MLSVARERRSEAVPAADRLVQRSNRFIDGRCCSRMALHECPPTVERSMRQRPRVHADTLSNAISTRAYVICCVPRSGSWLLADALDRTGTAGHPAEYFREEDVEQFLTSFKTDPVGGIRALLRSIRMAGQTPNGVFGLKMHGSQLIDLTSRLISLPEFADDRDGPRLDAVFGPLDYIYLRRTDTLRQALSFYRAFETDVWWWMSESEPSPAPPPGPLNIERVHALREVLRTHEDAWNTYFSRHDIQPYCVTYEDLAADYEITVRGVMDFLGLHHHELPLPRFRRQADELSDRWLLEFRDGSQRTAKRPRESSPNT